MFKKTFVTLGLMSLVASGLVACDCSKGCTPGFWKTGNHVQGFQTESYVDVFELEGAAAVKVNAMVNAVNVKKAYDKLPVPESLKNDNVLQLGEALWLQGNKDKYLQLVRTSAAALLNIRHFNKYAYLDKPSPYEPYWGSWMQEHELLNLVEAAFLGKIDAGQLQRDLDSYNNDGTCELHFLHY